MKPYAFFWRQRKMLHFMYLTKVLLLHPGILHLEAFGMLSICGKWIARYFLILSSEWGLIFLIFWREFFVAAVSVILLLCLCLHSMYWEVFCLVDIESMSWWLPNQWSEACVVRGRLPTCHCASFTGTLITGRCSVHFYIHRCVAISQSLLLFPLISRVGCNLA